MKYICITVMAFFVTVSTINARTIVDSFPTLTLSQKEIILKYALRSKLQFESIIKNGKPCFQVTHVIDDSMFYKPGNLKNWSAEQNFLILDFVIRDSLKAYKGINQLFKFKTRGDEINYYTEFLDRMQNDTLQDLTYEVFTIPQKVDMFLRNTVYQAKVKLDSFNKTMWFFGRGISREHTSDYANFCFAYIMRNRFSEFDTVGFMYFDKKNRLVQRYYKWDKDSYYSEERIGDKIIYNPFPDER